jgi:DNA-binding transcriptional regulator PaaX
MIVKLINKNLSDNEDAQVITANPAEAIDSVVRELWSLRNQTANFVAFEEESTQSLTSLFDKWEKRRVIQERILSHTIIVAMFTHC